MGFNESSDVLPSPNSEMKATDSIILKLQLNINFNHSSNILGVLSSCFTLGLDRGIQMMLTGICI